LALPPGALAAESGSFIASDGATLAYQVVAAPRPRHRLLYLHGIESHGSWFLPAAQALRDHGCSTWLLDRRGAGLNRHVSEAVSADRLLDDVRVMRAHLGPEPLHLVGLSWGGKLATAAALAQPDALKSLVLVTPGLVARVDLPLLTKAAVALDLLRGGHRRFEVPIRPEMFTATPAPLEFIRRDPWRTTAVAPQLLWASRVLDRRIRAGIRSLRPPVLLVLAGRDRIVDNDRILELLAPLAPGQLTVRLYEAATHAIQLEQAGALADDVARFLAAGDTSPC